MDFLTRDELTALNLTGVLANTIRRIIGEGPTAEADWREAAHEIHTVQLRIRAQAAARAYPTEFRLMGSVVEGRET